MEPRAAETTENAVTPRAVLIGFALLLILLPAAHYVEVVVGGGAPEGVPARIPVAVLFLLALLMGLPIFRRSGLTRRELFVVYVMLLIGLPLAHRAGIFYLVNKVIVYHYMARAVPIWETSFMPLIPAWWSPSDPLAVNGLFEGQTTPPWSHWWLPLAAWWSAMVALWLSTVCILILVQRQWISNERLTFPLAELPLDMVRQPRSRAPGRLAGGSMFWIGLVAAVVIMAPNFLKEYVPAVPAIPISVSVMENPRGILQGVERVLFYAPPAMIGLLYLVPKELSFSCWFFWILRQVFTVLGNVAGAAAQTGPRQQALLPREFQGAGAVFTLLLLVLWTGRRHLFAALKTAFGRGPRTLAGDSAGLYRWALIGFVASTAWMVYFFWLSGCRVGFSLIFLGLTVGYFLLWARMRAETGLGVVTYPVEVYQIAAIPLGSAWLRPREVLMLITMRWATWLTCDSTVAATTGHALDAFKVADSARIKLPKLTWTMLGAFIVAMIVGSLIVLKSVYGRGFFGTHAGAANYWPSLYMRQDGSVIHQMLTDHQPPQPNTIYAMLFGGIVTVILGYCRLRIWWWPFHPIGFIISTGADMGWFLFTFIIAWALKAVVIRAGGLRLYRATVPLAIGLIVGDLINGTFWMIVAIILRG